MQIKILIVDDSGTDRLSIKNMLSEYYILTARDSEEAMSVLEEHDGVDLLILNLNMPNMDGFQVLEALKENERLKEMRTIILTNHDELDNEIKGLKLGAVDYIRKPIHMDALKARIDVHVALLRAQQAIEQQLDEQTITFDMVFEQAPIGIAISYNYDPEHPDEAIVIFNSVYEQITGRTKEELTRLGWTKITHPDDLEEDMKNYKKLQSGEIKTYSMEKRYIKPDGSVVWAHVIVASFNLSNSKQYSHICLVQDITERKAIEKALKESERSKSVFLSHLPGLAYRCNYDRDWTMQYVSEGCFNLTGYPSESLLYNRDLSFKDIISPEYHEALWNRWEQILAKRQPFKYEYEIITATGEKKWVLELGQGIYNEQGEIEALEGIVLDISDRKVIEDTLKFNNEHDRWTGLYNRDYLESLFVKDVRLKKGIKKALIGINLSPVQLLTANYGFQYTQNLIKKAAEALNQYCTHNRLLFKAYENSFVFYIFDYKDKNELVDFSDVIAKTLEPLFATDRIGGGIGILEIEQNQNEVDIDLLMRRLLIASERSVGLFGKDFEASFYDEKLEAIVNRERDIVEALNAIAMGKNTNDHLFLQYQPIMNLRTGLISGFEALARLKTEKLGLVSPIEFISIAEKTKLIFSIGEKVIITAFRFLNKLKEHGYDEICVSVNISAIQLLQTDFADRLFELMREMQINPKSMGIEITESVFASDYETINNVIEKLRDAGLYIAIDDFGTGYSSLARVKELKVDCMKIDKMFIDKLIDADINKAITSDIISLSHKLGHYTIAEGVEHDIQLQYLKEHDCDKIQGYLISKPLDEEDAIKFLESKNKHNYQSNDSSSYR
ncbi:EAL domain-containing protein [Proteiniborus sp. DW1]|uniref:EAL domain-containing protein n=1 Tax=Proteiniborus sp. DW1 TaxID=1889883 RepID=UPI000942F97B|nr:EAL domain-containing protein [Proteiniborus sp. DW1]